MIWRHIPNHNKCPYVGFYVLKIFFRTTRD